MIFSVLTILVLDMVAATGVIETIPYLPSKEVARGYSGLILTTYFTDMANGQCSWISSTGRTINIFTGFASCSNRTDQQAIGFFVTCVNTSNTIFSTLKLPVVGDILLPTSNNNMVWNIICDGISNPIATLNVTVQNCIVDQPLTVSGASSGPYNTNGTFNCSDNGEIFYSNGTRLNIPETTCLYTAKWSGSEELECWKAPLPTIFSRYHPQKNSTIEVIEGNNLTLNCQYNDTNPPGSTYQFYFQNEVRTIQKNESALIENLTKNDDGKIVSCQAVTPLTLQLDETGRSNNLTIVVLYPPYENVTTICDWTVNSSGSCNVTFYSKPKSSFIGLFKNDTKINTSSKFDVMENTHRFVFHKLMVDENDAGSYYISVNSSVFPDPHKIYFTVKVRLPPTTPAPTTRPSSTSSLTPTSVSTSSAALQLTTTHLDDVPSENPQEIIIIIIISCAVVGSLVIIALLVICCCFRKQRKLKSTNKTDDAPEKEVRDNEIYVPFQTAGNEEGEIRDSQLVYETTNFDDTDSVEPIEEAYGTVEESKDEKKNSENTDNVEPIEEAYGTVKESNEKKKNYENLNEVEPVSEVSYGVVMKEKKKPQEDKAEESCENGNVSDDNELYTFVDLSKKNKNTLSRKKPDDDEEASDDSSDS